MLSIPPGWYLLKPKDVVVHYWNGKEFTTDIAPLGNGQYSSLTRGAYRKWRSAQRRIARHAKKHPKPAKVISLVLPEGYIEP